MSIVSACGMIVTIVTAVIFLGERFTLQEGIGTALILLSVVFIQRKITVSQNSGILFAIAGTTCYSLAIVSDTFILRRFDAISYTPVMCFLPVIPLFLSDVTIVKRLKGLMKRTYMQRMTLYSFFYGIQAITYYLAIRVGANASQMAPVSRAQIILTVLLAAIFLNERDRLKFKVIAAAMVSVGVFLLL